MLNIVNNDVKGGDNQDVPDNMFDMLVTKFQTQRNDEQFSLVKS